ncbi:MAG TPA: fused MFS/spermidine synthase [Steroidobacteraceae bacterium]|nr:fused MFS/spermidine synthase [Steroidobacteraceae bacterium]
MSIAGSPENNSNQASTTQHPDGPSSWTLLGVGACFALSGFAALLYQTAWMRQFSLVFGTSEIAVATVLAAYMGGLALGARAVDRFLDRVRRPVLVYGALEFGIALGALLVPVLLVAAESLMVAAIGQQPGPPNGEGWGQTAFYLITAFAVLVIPTALMGATLPLLTRHAVRTEAQIARRTGLLYAINTLGAVGGALVAAFVLLPELGLRGTVFVGAAINVLVFAIAAALSRAGAQARVTTLPGQVTRPPSQTWAQRLGFGRHWILPVMFASGALSFVYEVLWTRLLSFVLGGSLYAFATMVASFLLGIAVGSAAASHLARSQRISAGAFVVAQLAIAACSIAVYLALEGLVPDRAGLRGNVAIAIIVLLPATLFIGATFPLAVRILTDDPRLAASATARIYAWNTVGAIVGALLAGFVLIPELRFEGAIRFAVLGNALLALIVCIAVARAALAWSAVAAVGCAALAFLFHPQPPDKFLRTSPLNVSPAGQLRYYEVGRSASVVVLEQEGSLMLRTNGLPEAVIEMAGTAPRFSGEFWLSPLAVIARPATQSMLVIGYGGGVVVDGIAPTVRSVDVIELEPKVIDANRAVSALRARDPLTDRRVNLIVNDARGALSLTSRRYDAIVSQPSHPWTAGASHLYTREFMQQALAHLTEGGVFVQWMNIAFLDEELLRSLTATLLDVFGQVRIYRPDPNTFVFLASTAPLELERGLARTGAPLILAPRHFARFGIHTTEDVVAALVADLQGARALARGAQIITDDRNRMATAGAYDTGSSLTPETASRVLAQYDPLQRRDGNLLREPGLGLSHTYLARRVALFAAIDPGTPERLQRIARSLGDPADAAYAAAMAFNAVGDARSATRLLREAYGTDPANDAVRFELIRPWLPYLAQNRAPAAITETAAGLSGSGAAVVQAGRNAVAGDWAKMPALDEELRQARWTDAWYFEALQARAEWRTRVTNPEARARYGREALTMLEEAVTTQPTPAIFSLRARAALSADRPEVVLESIAGFAQGTLTNLARTDARALPELQRGVDALLQLIDSLGKDERVRPERREQVRDQLGRVRSQIQSRAAP